MAKLKVQGNASGTGVVTLTAPNTNTDRTITLPDDTQTLIGTNASGNVGIGTASPTSNIHIGATGADDKNELRIDGTNGSSGVFGTIIESDGENSRVSFKTGSNGATPTQKLMIHPDGGICFGTDTAAANALDDYEEGTWTPTLSGGTTSSFLQYTKIGRVVHISGTISFTSITGSGTMTIGGLPFVSGSWTEAYQSLNSHAYDSLNVGGTYAFQTLRVDSNNTTLKIIIPRGDGGIRTFGDYSHVSSGAFSFRVNGSYMTN